MKYYIGNTDKDWYDFLKKLSPDDINFWQPGGSSIFQVLQPGAPFLFLETIIDLLLLNSP